MASAATRVLIQLGEGFLQPLVRPEHDDPAMRGHPSTAASSPACVISRQKFVNIG
jgi:hypothetical protein